VPLAIWRWTQSCLCLYGSGRSLLVWYPPPQRHSRHYFCSLCNTTIPVYHVISPSSSCLESKPSIKVERVGGQSVLGLPAVGWIRSLNSVQWVFPNCVWILVPAVEGKGPCCNGCAKSVATKVLLGFYFIMWLGLHCPILCDWSWKHNEGFCWGLFCMCLGFHCPICDSVRCCRWWVTFFFWVFCLDQLSWLGLQVC
jgi:hypothetical protein